MGPQALQSNADDVEEKGSRLAEHFTRREVTAREVTARRVFASCVLPPVRAPSASPRGRQDGATARAAGTAQNEARSAQTGRTGRTAQTARAAQPIAVAARTVCAADWAALPSANRPYGRRQLPEHAMSSQGQ